MPTRNSTKRRQRETVKNNQNERVREPAEPNMELMQGNMHPNDCGIHSDFQLDAGRQGILNKKGHNSARSFEPGYLSKTRCLTQKCRLDDSVTVKDLIGHQKTKMDLANQGKNTYYAPCKGEQQRNRPTKTHVTGQPLNWSMSVPAATSLHWCAFSFIVELGLRTLALSSVCTSSYT